MSDGTGTCGGAAKGFKEGPGTRNLGRKLVKDSDSKLERNWGLHGALLEVNQAFH